jgi:hypothetical protein
MTNRKVGEMFFISMSVSMLFICAKMDIKFMSGFNNLDELNAIYLNFWAGFTGALSVSIGSLLGYFFVEYFKKKENEQHYYCFWWPWY